MRKTAPTKRNRRNTIKVDELRESTAQYDREMAIDEFQPPGTEARRRWERARQKPGRPKRGQGARIISVSVEKSLLAQSDSLAKNLGLTRARLIERGLKAVLAAEGKL